MGVCCVLIPAAGFGDEGVIMEDVEFDECECAGMVFDAPRLEDTGWR
jgi:hypothetical protein